MLDDITPNLMKTLKQQYVGIELSERSESCSNSTEARIRFWNNSIIQTHNIQDGEPPILENSKQWDLGLELLDRSEIWQASLQQFCPAPDQISEQQRHFNTKNCGF